MYYNVYEGMQNTWSDRFSSVTRQVTSHNWLPAATAGMVALWVGLLFTAINQTGPANPGTPSNVGTKSGQAMSVTTASATTAVTPPSDNSHITNSAANPSVAAQPAAATPPARVPSVPSNSTAQPSTGDVIGGRGADTPTTPQTSPTTPTPDTPTDTGVGVGLSVQTPLTSDPITVGLDVNSGVQLDLGL